jgi:hypothetical protein
MKREIYNENIFDLLSKNKSKSHNIREDKVNGIYVTNLNQIVVGNENDVKELLEEGTKRRTVGETKMNATSSRSHAVFTIYMEQVDLLWCMIKMI